MQKQKAARANKKKEIVDAIKKNSVVSVERTIVTLTDLLRETGVHRQALVNTNYDQERS